jgi:hypothetical protein
VTPFHRRWRREISLLAADALRGDERAAAERHAASCAACGADLAALRGVLAMAADDDARAAEPPVDVQWLKARVAARVAQAPPPRPRRVAAWVPALAAAALAAVLVWSWPAGTPAPEPPRTAAAPSAPTRIAVSDEALERMERTMARERAARYLDEAQDVLVTVAGAPRKCHREDQHVDMADESRRSRELLARRAALDLDGSAEAAAGPVLDDVEKVLREVASLEGCARRRDVEAIHREVERERLLMRMDLTARELAG